MICKICGQESKAAFSHLILKKYTVTYFSCSHCGFMQTEDTYWLQEAYENALNLEDTGILVRNERLRDACTLLFTNQFNPNAKYIDYAGGYGVFTRMMRDIGFHFYWVDKYATNLLARGFEHVPNTSYEAITAFEVFEHLVQPMDELKEMLEYSDTIVFSTVLLPEAIPAENWWYYAFDHGQHIAFYQKKTLEYIAQQLNLHFYTNGTHFHMLSKKSMSPWLFTWYYKAAKYGMAKWAKRLMKSLTDSDSKLLSQQR